MKRTILFFAIATFALTACSKEMLLPQGNIDEHVCELTINIHQTGQPVTKANSVYTEELEYETVINSLQLLIFDDDSLLRHYSAVEKSEDGYKKTLSISTGKKHIWAVANSTDLSRIKTEKELTEFVVRLEDNSTDASHGFIMAGSQPVELSGSSATANISMSRLVGRIALCSITNNLPDAYGAITINRIFLSNVVGNQNFKGDAKPVLWYNKEGRKDEETRDSEHIIDGSTYKASCESLTFKDINSTLAAHDSFVPADGCVFYGMPNSSTDAPKGFFEQFSAQSTVLVVVTTINSRTYYYPVVMNNGISRNSSYSVYLTITDLGSDDPNKPVTRGNLDITIEVKNWDTSTASIEETI